MSIALQAMSDEQLVATLCAIYQTQDARAEIPTCRFCGAVFTSEEAEGALMRARRSRALAHIVPILAEEAGRGRKRIGEDLLFQSGPGKAINRPQPGFDGGDLGGAPVER